MDTQEDVYSCSNGEVAVWSDDGRAIHLKAVTSFGDPVELSADQARQLAVRLLRLVDELE